MCIHCEGSYGKDIDIMPSPDNKETQPNKAQIIQSECDKPGIVLFNNGLATRIIKEFLTGLFFNV